MTKYIHRTVITLAALIIFASGCASTKQYALYAQAGTTYVAAVDRLLITAGNVGIDATSERLLQDDMLKNQDLDSYQKLSTVDVERLAIIGRLRTHARLLARYFGILNELATSDTPERAREAVGGIVNRLNTLGNGLRGRELVPNKEAFTAVTKVTVGFIIRGLLRDELNKRKDMIQIELKTQEELLKALTDAIQHDLTIINQTREQRLVIAPLVATTPVVKPDDWVTHRRMVITSQARVAELATAGGAAGELREAFEDLVKGELDLEGVNTLLTDLESLLAVAEAINR